MSQSPPRLQLRGVRIQQRTLPSGKVETSVRMRHEELCEQSETGTTWCGEVREYEYRVE